MKGRDETDCRGAWRTRGGIATDDTAAASPFAPAAHQPRNRENAP